MIVRVEYDLSDFQPWSGAVSTWDRIQDEGKLGEFEGVLEDLYPDGINETTLNDLLWFDSDWIYESLGIRTEKQIQDEIDEKQEELDNLLAEWAEIIEDESYTEEEKQEEWENNYKDDVENLKDEIAELKEELDNI